MFWEIDILRDRSLILFYRNLYKQFIFEVLMDGAFERFGFFSNPKPTLLTRGPVVGRNRLLGLASFEAHNVVASNNILYALCTENSVKTIPAETRNPIFSLFDEPADSTERSCRVFGYDMSGQLLRGFLKPADIRRSSVWNQITPTSAERIISQDIIEGSTRHGFPGIKEGDHVLVRVVGDNSQMARPTVTYFFEPVITIREDDVAYAMFENRRMETGVYRPGGGRKSWEYAPGDVVRDIPIVTTAPTRFGKVGVGYVPRPEIEFSGLGLAERQPSSHKRVLVLGGAGSVGGIIEEAYITCDKGVILADAR